LGIPTLAAVLDLIQNRCAVNIELKTKSAAQPTLDLVAKYCESRKASFNSILISSFDWDILREISHQKPKYQLGILYEEKSLDAIALAETIGAFSLHPNYKLLTFEIVKKIQAFGFKVFPWTVNDPSAITTLTSWHVDGIISDFPDRI
jgi:glycerophosphoryl diester phosphodiesterase